MSNYINAIPYTVLQKKPKQPKENALPDFMRTCRQSWTWERLTDREQAAFMHTATTAKLRGTYNQRREQLHDLYASFLSGLGYKPFGWREPTEEATA